MSGLCPSRSVDVFKASTTVRSYPGREADDETVALARVAITEFAAEGARVLIEHVKDRVFQIAVLSEDVERELVPPAKAVAHPESDARIVNEASLVLLHVDGIGGARVAGLKDMETFKASGAEDMLFARWTGLSTVAQNGAPSAAAIPAWIARVRTSAGMSPAFSFPST